MSPGGREMGFLRDRPGNGWAGEASLAITQAKEWF